MGFGNSSFGGSGSQGLDSIGSAGGDIGPNRDGTNVADTGGSGGWGTSEDSADIGAKIAANGYKDRGDGTFETPDGQSLVNAKGDVVGRKTALDGFMTANKGYQFNTTGTNDYGIDDPRNSYHGGYRGAKEAIRQGASSGWTNTSRAGLMDRMKGLPHAQRDAYLTAFDHAQFDGIPDQYMSTAHEQVAQGHLDALNGPIASALNLTQTPYEAINDLARDLTFSDVAEGDDFTNGGDMSLKASGVLSRMFGSDLYSKPAGAAAMTAGSMVGGVTGKITSALGQFALTPGPTTALGWMKNSLNLGQTAHVAGVKSPDRSTFHDKESGGAFTLPSSVQTTATRSPASSTSKSVTQSVASLSRASLTSMYDGYGYTLI